MLIYKDVITGDELFSDSYSIKLFDECYYEVEGKLHTEKDGDYSGMIGANPSAEGGDEGLDPSERTDINIVIAHKLQKTYFQKKSFLIYIKDYMKRVIEHIDETDSGKIESLKRKLQAKVKNILENFNDYEFYSGESMNPDGCVLFLNYREDGMTPFFTVFKVSVVSEKY